MLGHAHHHLPQFGFSLGKASELIRQAEFIRVFGRPRSRHGSTGCYFVETARWGCIRHGRQCDRSQTQRAGK